MCPLFHYIVLKCAGGYFPFKWNIVYIFVCYKRWLMLKIKVMWKWNCSYSMLSTYWNKQWNCIIYSWWRNFYYHILSSEYVYPSNLTILNFLFQYSKALDNYLAGILPTKTSQQTYAMLFETSKLSVCIYIDLLIDTSHYCCI